jgi:hypothetical protein
MEMAGMQDGHMMGGGAVAARLLNANMDPSALRPFINANGVPCISMVRNGKPVAVPAPLANAVLLRDEWKEIDAAVTRARQVRSVGIQDLISRGLTYQLSNAMGSTVLESTASGDSGVAQIDMDGVNRSPNDRPDMTPSLLPLPIIHSDFQFNSRVLAISRKRGDSIDTIQAENATRRVVEMTENLLFGSADYQFGGGHLYSYTTHPNRMLAHIAAPWNASSTTGQAIIDNVIAWKQLLIDQKFYGPYVLYTSTDYESVLDSDYGTNYAKTIRQRLMEIGGITQVSVADHLASGTVLLVNMSSDVVRLVDGMAPTPMQWETEGGFVINFKVMSIRVPHVRPTLNSTPTGIVHASE